MATKLGFDEQTAEDRVVVTLSKNEQFRQKKRIKHQIKVLIQMF